jgi:predicted phage tail protein
MGGRILTVVGADITIDKGITLPAGTHTISYISDTGTLNTRTTTVGAGTFTALTLAGADPMPSVGSIFGITTTTLIPQLFRIDF